MKVAATLAQGITFKYKAHIGEIEIRLQVCKSYFFFWIILLFCHNYVMDRAI